MRRPSARALPSSALFQTMTDAPDNSGDSSNGVPSSGTTLRCSKQDRTMSRQITHSAAGAVIDGTLYFADLPVDTSANARAPGTCQVGDTFTVNGDVCVALGKPRPEGGQTGLFGVDYQLRPAPHE